MLVPVPPTSGTNRLVAVRITATTTSVTTVATGIHTFFRRGRHLAISLNDPPVTPVLSTSPGPPPSAQSLQSWFADDGDERLCDLSSSCPQT
jgi:hypothetical protein